MASVKPRTISTNWNMLLISGNVDAPAPWCTVCREILEIHQPDIDRPDRFLATCANCGAWHLFEQPEDGARSLLAKLPEFSELLRPEKPAALPRPRAKSR